MAFFPHLIINNMYLNVVLAVDKTLMPLKSQLSSLTVLVYNLNTGTSLLVIGFLFSLIKACGLLNRSQSLNIKQAARLLAVGRF